MSLLPGKKYGSLLFLLAFLLIGTVNRLPAQMTQMKFGKNRVQYKDFIWSFYETKHFSIYYYRGGQNLGRYVVEAAEKNLKQIEKKLEYRINTPLQIIVYKNLTDLKQNNIGRGVDIYNRGGLTKIIGTKIFLHFNGNHSDLEQQLREGIARVFLNDMMFGGDIQDAVQNAVLLNLPEWFKKGLVSYAGQSWNAHLDNRLRDGILSGKYNKFHRLSGKDARFAGHSIWHYIAQKYGKNAIPNILYLTRINRSLESGFLFVLGKSVEEVLREWHTFYENKYNEEVQQLNSPPDSLLTGKKSKRKPKYYELAVSPDAQRIAYVTNEIGRYKVNVYHRTEDKRNTILRGGYKSLKRITDYSYPQLDWSPNGEKLAMLYEKKDKIHLVTRDIKSGNEKVNHLDPYFQKVTDFSFAQNGKTLVVSAIVEGQSDIFYFHIPSNRVIRITQDYYDDMDPHYVNITNKYGEKKEGVLFVSNRPHDSIKKTNIRNLDTIPSHQEYNIYFYNHQTKSKQLIPITNTSIIQEMDPMAYNQHWLTYLSDENGIQNRYVGYLDTTFSHKDTIVYHRDSTVKNPSLPQYKYAQIPTKNIDSYHVKPIFKDTAITFPITNRSRNILEHDIPQKSDTIIDLMLHKGRYRFYAYPQKSELSTADAFYLPTTHFRKTRPLTKPEKQKSTSESPTTPDTNSSNQKSTYYFQPPGSPETQKSSPPSSSTPKPKEKPAKAKKSFISTDVEPYHVKFSTEYVLSQLDNTVKFTPYQNFTGNGPIFQNPKLSPLIQVSITDLFENYRFTGGFRVPTNFSGSEYFLSFDYLEHRLDKHFMYYRRVSSKISENQTLPRRLFLKNKMNYIEGGLTWPFSPISSLHGYAGYRNDHIDTLAREPSTLLADDFNENWFLLRLSYVFDNTIKWHKNTLEGWRLKVFGEARKMVNDVNIDPLDLQPEKSHLFILGTDIRNYFNIHRQIIFANRFSMGTSLGPRKLIYYLGGVDNSLFPKFNTETPISSNQNYAFQTLATNMRGFRQNIRNGNSYAVFNSEIRIPFFRYTHLFMNSTFFKNFQFIGFGDVGTAWIGPSPFSEENPLNKQVIGQPPVVVRVDYLRNPIVQGYGFGARSTVLGYFLRFDVAWGLEDGKFNPPMYYLSLSLDF